MRYAHRYFESVPRCITNAGRRVKPTYILDVSPNGEKKLVENGTIDIQAEINSHESLCDVKSIIDRFSMSGELDMLSARGNVVDLTAYPSNLADTLKLLRKAEESYNSLRPDVKCNYPDYDSFLAQFGSASAALTFLNTYANSDTDTKENFDEASES